MSFNTMLSDMQSILNRDDCSTALATTFLIQGIQRIQRDCRLPNMERALVINPVTAMTSFPAPQDLIQPIDVIWVPAAAGTNSVALPKKSYRQLLNISPTDIPRAYARLQMQFYVSGAIPAGDQLQFIYYGNFSPFANANADNELSASTPDLGVYAGLAYAGDYFDHPNTPQWEARYQAIKAEVQMMGQDLDAEGGPQSVSEIFCEGGW